jgi:hypothetical protein
MRNKIPSRHSLMLAVFALLGVKKPGCDVCHGRRKRVRAVTVLLLILIVSLGFGLENFSSAKQPPWVSASFGHLRLGVMKPTLPDPNLALETRLVSKKPSIRIPPPVECYVSTATWQNDPFVIQTTPFVVQFDMTPNRAYMDGVTGLSLDPALYYNDLAAIVRFNVTGYMDAIDGDNYRADTVIPYSLGRTYHYRLLVYPASHLYTIYVTAPGSAETVLGANFRFRSAQSSTSSLNYWSLYSEIPSHSVCGFGTTAFGSSDVTAPTVSIIDPQQGATVSGIVSVSATAADDIGVVGVQLKVDGKPIGNELSALPYVRSWDSATVPNGTHILTATARDAAGNATTSASVTVITNNVASAAACPVSTSIWQNKPIATQSAQFQASFDATPNLANMDGVTGFSLGTADAYARLAISIRFNRSGFIDARNGANYAATSSVSYLPGQNYHFRLIINPSAQVYTIFVTPPGSPEITLGTNFAFQIAFSRLNYWVFYSEMGSHTICNFAIGPVSPAPDFSISASPASQTVTAGSSATTSVSIGSLNAFNGNVNLGASGLPAGAAASFSPAIVTGSGTSTLTIKTTAGTPAGPHAITITGTSGSDTHSTTYTLTVISTTLYETESTTVFNGSKSSGPVYRVFAWTGFTDGQGTTLDGNAAGQSVTITLNVPGAGIYDVQFATKAHFTRGIVQLTVKGANVGPAEDEYSANDVWEQFDLGTVSLPAGNVAFVFTTTGKNPASSGFTQAFDYIKLTRK